MRVGDAVPFALRWDTARKPLICSCRSVAWPVNPHAWDWQEIFHLQEQNYVTISLPDQRSTAFPPMKWSPCLPEQDINTIPEQ